MVLLADGEVEVFELLVEGLGLRGVRTLDFDEVVDVEAEGTDLAAKLVGRLGPVLLADVLTNILVDASLQIIRNRIVSLSFTVAVVIVIAFTRTK